MDPGDIPIRTGIDDYLAGKVVFPENSGRI